jgi:hypothetical protein
MTDEPVKVSGLDCPHEVSKDNVEVLLYVQGCTMV